MRHYGNNDVCVSILKTINFGEGMPIRSYYAGLSTWQLNDCLTLLQKNSLIEYEKDSQIHITKKGTQYLNAYNKILELLSFKTRKSEELVAA